MTIRLGRATHNRPQSELRAGRMVKLDPIPFEVRVMAIAEGYAMIRHKGCMPFVVSEKELSQPEKPNGKARSTR